MPRTPEEGHSVECLSKAMISAIQNHRDELVGLHTRNPETYSRSCIDYDMRIWAQDNVTLYMADRLLVDGSAICICE